MARFFEQIQMRLKTTSFDLLNYTLRLLTGMVIGLTLATVGQELWHFGTFAFAFVIVSLTATFLRVSRSWSLTYVFVFILFCVLLALLLRMYILIAPGQ